jgi:mRNA (2'-O-methyladenosine-N6-)-methyltransferase
MDEAGLARCLRTADSLLGTSASPEVCDHAIVSDLVEQHRGCIREIEQYTQALAGPAAIKAAAAGAPSTHGQEDVGSCADVDPQEWQVPPHCIPIHANVTTYPWSRLYQHTQFDVIMMDPPWQLATSNPTRGVALGYSQLTDADIRALPIPQLQSNGLLFMWVINAKFRFTLELFEQWGYR